jgi:type IV secretion system protein VirD4
MANVVATQAVAAYFRYQPGLGEPLLRWGTVALYQPFGWIAWQFLPIEDAQVRAHLAMGTFVALAGVVATFGLVTLITNARRRRLMQGMEHLHGSARWAGDAEVTETGLVTSRSGVYVGGWYDSKAQMIRYLRHNGPEHILAFAPTRSGKGVGLVIPTLLAWPESAVIYDIKGENWAKTAGFRSQQGHLCFKFSPVEDGTSSRFNPLAEMRLFTPRDVSDAQNVADMIVRTGGDSPQERYWQDAAASIVTGMILHVCYAARRDGKTACLADLAGAFTRPGTSFDATLVQLLSYQHDPGKQHGWTLPGGISTATHPVVRTKAQEMLDKGEKDRSGVLSMAQTALTLFSDPLVANNTAASDFTIQDLVNHEKPVSLYLVVPPSDKIRLRPLIRLVFTMIVNRLTERMDFQGTSQLHNLHRLLFLIDEFPSLHRMELFADALSYMAGYGLKAYLIAQDICQIIEEYGPNQSLVSNCHIRIAYAPNNFETAELLSRMTGQRTVERAAISYSGNNTAAVLPHVNASVENIERPLLTPDEVMRIKPATKEGEGSDERIVAPGDMLVFVSGHHAIYGMQMLYFMDPELQRRAAIPAPTGMYTIQNAKAVPQPPISRAANLLSAPEPDPPAPAASKGEGSRAPQAAQLELALDSEPEAEAPIEIVPRWRLDREADFWDS